MSIGTTLLLKNRLPKLLFVIALSIGLIAIINTGNSMAKPQNTLIKLNLSGKQVSFLTPENYSKDFPRPAETQYKINIYDNDIYISPYTDSSNAFEIRQSNWDYGKGLIFGGVKGTLSMNIALFRTSHSDLIQDNGEGFLSVLKRDFEEIHDEESRETFSISEPKKYEMKSITNLDWGYYEYLARQGRRFTYAFPIDDQIYLKINFSFINNSDTENNWEKLAQETIDNIIASFQVKKN